MDPRTGIGECPPLRMRGWALCYSGRVHNLHIWCRRVARNGVKRRSVAPLTSYLGGRSYL